jgi:glucokinase
MTITIGVDLGGTKIAAAALDTESHQLSGRITTPSEGHLGPDGVLARIADVVRQVCEEAGIALETVAGIGLGVPGTIDVERGLMLVMANLPGDWHRKPIGPILGDALGRPVWLINDARAFSLAEASLGAGKGAPTVACFTLGTGIGGGIVIDGRLHLGLDGCAGEFGHHTIDVKGPLDGIGNPGGWEALASGPAIAAMGVRAVMQGFTTQIGELVEHDLNRISPQIIKQAAENGDKIAQDILNEAGAYLGAGIANVITILAPHRVVIGGGLAQLGDWIMNPIRDTIKARCGTVPLEKLQIVPAALGTDAGIIGAALWASQQRRS